MSEDLDRRSRFRSLKLHALVRDHLGREPDADRDGVFPLGAAMVTGDDAWVLIEDEPERGLGSALAWVRRHGQTASGEAPGTIHVLAGQGTGLLARRAAAFDLPISVWHVDNRSLLPAVAEPLLPPAPPRDEHLELIPVITAGGAEPVIEHGVVTGEVRGLEVCRVVDDPVTGAVRLEVGVGAHDREAFALIHGDIPAADALAGVVASVEEHRRAGANGHPLSRLAPERLLRWTLLQQPARLGLARLVDRPPPTPRTNIKDRTPCSARGERSDGTPVVVVCSVGVDLDVVPYASDARLAAAMEREGEPGYLERVETWVVAPGRDLVAITAELATSLRDPVRLVAAPDH